MSSVKIHSNETGQFPIQSISGTKYAMFIYAYDPNAIIVEPLQERIKEFILQAYQKIIGHLTNRGLQTKTTTLQQWGITDTSKWNGQQQHQLANSATRKP